MSQKHLLSDVSKIMLIINLYSFLSGTNHYFLANDLSGLIRKRSNKNITNRVFKVLKALEAFKRAKN
jgi:hypothetical protein